MNTSQSLAPKTILRSGRQEYVIERTLGSGSFGITYLASSIIRLGNVSMTVHFAIKEHFMDSCYRLEDGMTVNCTPAMRRQTEMSRADFLTEAKRLQKICLKAPGIVKVNETFETNGTAYYVMEYLNGGNPEKMGERDALRLMIQVAQSVAAIHRERMLHLDIKPANIVMKTNDDGQSFPVLIDFGIAKHFDSKGHPTSRIKAKGVSTGYAPQEQYSEISEFSPKYDVYALGGVLLYLVSGKNPPAAFEIDPNMAQIRALIPENVSEATRNIILGAMQPQAFNRTPSADAMTGQLQEALLRLDAPKQPAMPTPVMPQPAMPIPTPVAKPVAQKPAPAKNEAAAPQQKAEPKVVAAQKPVAQKPIAQKPIAQKPVAQKPEPKVAQPAENAIVAQVVAPPMTQERPEQPQRVATMPLSRDNSKSPKAKFASTPKQNIKKKNGKLPLIIGGAVFLSVALLAIIGLSVGDDKKAIEFDDEIAVVEETFENNDSTTTSTLNVTNATFNVPGRKETFVYTGTVNERGLPDGVGKGVYALGTYEGRYVNGSREGFGRYTTKDGSNVFEGTFHGDQYEKGRLTFPNDDYIYYEGSFVNNNFDDGEWYNSDGTPR